MSALTSDKALDSTYMKAFIATYRSFATPWQLFEKLVQRYNVPSSMPSERGLPIKLRVSVVIKSAFSLFFTPPVFLSLLISASQVLGGVPL